MTSGIVIVVLVLALVPLLLFFGALSRQKRREAMERIAAENGLVFKPEGDFVPKVLSHFELFRRGRMRQASNVLEDVSDAQAFWVFDYEFTVGSGKHRRTYRQTVVAFPYLDVNLPGFTVRRERVFHKLATIFGYQDIDFPDHPSFSTRHLVRGQDPRAIQALFDNDLIIAVDSIEHVCLEGGGSCLLVFRDNETIKPEKVTEFLGQAQGLCDALVARALELGWTQKHSAEPASVYDG